MGSYSSRSGQLNPHTAHDLSANTKARNPAQDLAPGVSCTWELFEVPESVSSGKTAFYSFALAEKLG